MSRCNESVKFSRSGCSGGFWALVHTSTAFLHMIVHVIGGREPDGLVSRSADTGKGHESLSFDFSTVKI